jgi:hypothetical protein
VKHATAAPESCAIKFTDNTPQSTITSIAVGQTFVPTSSGPAKGRTGTTGVFTAYEANYDTIAAGGGFSAAPSGSCVNPTAAGETIDGSYNYSESFQLTFTAAGTCAVTFTDAYGQTTTVNMPVYNDPVYALTLGGPSAGSINVGAPFSFSLTAAVGNGGTDPIDPPTIPVYISGFTSGVCSAGPSGDQPSATTFSGSGSGPGTCTVTGAADASGVAFASVNNSPLSFQIAVTATPAPTPAPTCPPGDSGTPPNCIPVSAPTPTPTPNPGICPIMCLTILANIQQTLPNPPYTTNAASLNSCSPSMLAFGPNNQCPYMLGTVPINMSRINQSALCWTAFPLYTTDNNGWPISLLALTADITPVAWYDSLTGFLYVVNSGGPSVIWTPPGFLVGAASFPGEDMYYIQNIMPTFNSGGRYLWVALSYWQLPTGADAAGPVPLSMDGGLIDPYIADPGHVASECLRSSVFGGPLVFGS